MNLVRAKHLLRTFTAGMAMGAVILGCGALLSSPQHRSSAGERGDNTARVLERVDKHALGGPVRAGVALSALVVLGHAQEGYVEGRLTTARLRVLSGYLGTAADALPEEDRWRTLRAQAELAVAEVELHMLEGPGGGESEDAQSYRELVRIAKDAHDDDDEASEPREMDARVLLEVVEDDDHEEAVHEAHADVALDEPSEASVQRVLERLNAVDVPVSSAEPASPSLEDASSPEGSSVDAGERKEAQGPWVLSWPLEKVHVTSGYGMRRDPVRKKRRGKKKRKKKRMHRGTDLRGAKGTPVFAAGPGEVVLAGWGGRGSGNAVVIRHPGGVVTQYYHLSKVSTAAGTWIEAGEKLGEVGATGRVTGAHLHFQVSVDGKDVDPEKVVGQSYGGD